MLMKNIPKLQAGFTIIELMITLVVAGALLAVGMPAMREFVQNARITSVTNELVSALMLARSEAIRQNTQACVCPTTNTTLAAPLCAANGNWETGWIAFSDFNGDCVINGAAPNTDQLLKVWDGTAYAGGLTVRNDNASINGVNAVVFNNRGEPFAAGNNQSGNFSICDDRTPIFDAMGNTRNAAAVTVNAAGRTRSTRQQTFITYTAP
ncbi:MAG: GspH/FimT family pseudopilin [Gammaproteobacteria bacterium]|nr:GspH/FimT family pseudopilin [Gammaproteobacteria bacterium]